MLRLVMLQRPDSTNWQQSATGTPTPRDDHSFGLTVLSSRSQKKRDGTTQLGNQIESIKGKFTKSRNCITGGTAPYDKQQADAFSTLSMEGKERFAELREKHPIQRVCNMSTGLCGRRRHQEVHILLVVAPLAHASW